MKDYWVSMSFMVEALDYDEAVEIAKAVRKAIEDKHAAHGYKLRDVTTDTIEEV